MMLETRIMVILSGGRSDWKGTHGCSSDSGGLFLTLVGGYMGAPFVKIC